VSNITLPRAEELDTLWDKSVNESIKAGDGLARYRYAEQVAAAEREACRQACKALADAAKEEAYYRAHMECEAAIRARGSKT
jgi:hypothetical protein